MNKEIRHELNVISDELRKAGGRIDLQKVLESRSPCCSREAVDALQAAEKKLLEVIEHIQDAIEQDGEAAPKPRRSRKREPAVTINLRNGSTCG